MVLFAGIVRSENLPQPAALGFCEHPSWGARAHIQNIVLKLKRKLTAIAVGSPATVGQSLNAAFLVAIEDLVAGFTGDAELSPRVLPSVRQLAGGPQTAAFRPSPNTPSKASLPPQMGKKRNLCVRYDLLPMSRVAHKMIVSSPRIVKPRKAASEKGLTYVDKRMALQSKSGEFNLLNHVCMIFGACVTLQGTGR